MTYLIIISLAVVLTACTLIHVEVGSKDEGTTTIEPNGINVSVEDED